ncbi:unnamed protein product [Leuciscus chuanchicus]
MSAGGRLGLSVHPSVGCALDDCALVDIVRKMAADGGPVSPLWSENTFDSFCVVAHEELSKMPAQKEIQQLPPLKLLIQYDIHPLTALDNVATLQSRFSILDNSISAGGRGGEIDR